MEPLDLEMEIPVHIWDAFLREINRWNVRKFGDKHPVWIELTEDEVPEALNHFGFTPLVRRILHPAGDQQMSFHISPRRIRRTQKSSIPLDDLIEVIDERMAVTISSANGVRFALCHGLPAPVLKLAEPNLKLLRSRAEAHIRPYLND